jgi:pyrroline-5-carboxylate reductase
MSRDHAPITLVGAGRMGLALLAGWAARGLAGPGTRILEPAPSPALEALCRQHGMALNPPDRHAAGTLVLAIKPQSLDAAAPLLGDLAGPDTLVVSILAGKSIADLAQRMPLAKAIVRAMPNTPAAIGRGMTGLVANAGTTPGQRATAQALLESVGEAVWIPDESLMDVVTAVSGSGPAYVFLFAEVLAAAGRACGLPEDLAMKLARGTVEGAAALMAASPDVAAATLRENVTSPGGTTAAALGVLMAQEGLSPLVERAVAAATTRGRELSG